jgi:hypothetical protein
MGDKPPAASGALAGIYLLSALVVCVGTGLVLGWAAGNIVAGGAAGAVVGIPLSFYLLFRQYRNI